MIEKIRADLRERRLSAPQPWKQPLGEDRAKILADMVQQHPAKSMRGDLVKTIKQSRALKRHVSLGFALTKLRQCFSRNSDWLAFIEEHKAELGSATEITKAIGFVVYRKSMMRCPECRTETLCQCGCGVPYTLDQSWLMEPEPEPEVSAFERAKAAIAANPSKSNRLIAKEIGVDEGTVRNARKHSAPDSAPDVSPGRSEEANGFKITLLLRGEHAANLAWYDDDQPVDDDILQSMAYARDKWSALYERSKNRRKS